MRKFVYCISLLLAAFCTTAMAQEPYNILKIEGMVPTTNGRTTYYIKNVGTGLYISYGGEWGKHCKESRAAHPFILENNGSGMVALASLGGYLESATLWMDWTKETSKWTLQPVGGEYVNQYYLVGDNGRALTSVGNSAGLLNMTPLENKAAQRWIFLTEDEIRNNRMPKATAEKPFDVTPLIMGAAFDLIDGESVLSNTPTIFQNALPYLDNLWTNFEANKKNDMWHCAIVPERAIDYNSCGIIKGSANALTITYTVTLPAGTYSYSFEGFYKYMKVTTEQDQKRTSRNGNWNNDGDLRTISTTDGGTSNAFTVSINGASTTLASHPNDKVYEPDYVSSTIAAAEFRDNDTYEHRGTFYLSRTTKVSIEIKKAATTSNQSTSVVTETTNSWLGSYESARTVTTVSYPSQIFIDDITLLYFGNGQLAEDEVNDNNLFNSYLDANINEYIESLPEEEQEAAKEALENMDKDNITSVEDFYGAFEELEEIVTEVKQEQEKNEVLGNTPTDEEGNILDEDGNIIEGGSADFASLITNSSFEKGISTGWTIANNDGDTGVKYNAGDYVTTGIDGDYLFNTWPQGTRLTQKLTGLPNGIYKMTVSLASDANNTIILIGNDSEREVTVTNGGEVFDDFNIKFRVTDGTATVGVVGGNDGANWYKADNFRLTLLNDHLVLNENDVETSRGLLSSADYWYGKLTLYRTIKNTGTWNTFVIPFDMEIPENWEVMELTRSGIDEDGNFELEFSPAEDVIEAGVPYMIRIQGMDENITEFKLTDIYVNATAKDVETEHVAFRGVWNKGYVPIGSYFISNNKFYRSINETNRDNLKGYRAYIEPKVTDEGKARSLSFRFASAGESEEGTTGIGDQATEEATVVGIYTLGGVRIDEMQQGVNILRMSDGSVVKVIIK